MVEADEMRETMGREECCVVESRRCRKGASAGKAVESAEMPPSTAEMGSREVPAAETTSKVATTEPPPKWPPLKPPPRAAAVSVIPSESPGTSAIVTRAATKRFRRDMVDLQRDTPVFSSEQAGSV